MIDVLNYYDVILDRDHICPSVYFEWNTYKVFNSLGNFNSILPNFKMDNDGNPISGAKSGVADIIVNYDKIDLILECSLRSGVTQVDYEGNSVYRHSVDNIKPNKKCITLFLAPTIHDDLYEYYSYRSNVSIIPLDLSQFKKFILSVEGSNVQLSLLNLLETLSYRDSFSSPLNWKFKIASYINNL